MAIALIAIGSAGTLLAQALSDSPQRQEKQRAELQGPNGIPTGMEVIASVAEYKPGEGIDLHLHHGIEALYVVQGAQIQVAGKEPQTLPTGASLMNLRMVQHGGFKVIGDTPLKLFTVHIVDKSKPLYDKSAGLAGTK
ncbi:cupin domain-containing protein [Undibacterium sp. LX40W]|uniref:Cupin domain-containing protein n=1 Tax=Undibacterium nitidum TaxID=2762298 RepID=A0A923HML0_9BURK|nr:cupin domain-containing protein [Undibacterium nitidum]MBC3890698.1 cupin domain-containing protein [Undibacterium sp. LX40W]